MAAVREVETQDRVAVLKEREVDRGVGLGARVRLDVRVLGTEQRLGPVDRQLLGHVHELTAAVVAPARVALGVLVGQHRALDLEDRGRREVLRRDHLQGRPLPPQLTVYRRGDLGIDRRQRFVPAGPVAAVFGHCQDSSMSCAYAAASSMPPCSPSSRTLNSQPSPYGSELIKAGSSVTAAFTGGARPLPRGKIYRCG